MKTAVFPGQGELFPALDPTVVDPSAAAPAPEQVPAPLVEQRQPESPDPHAERRAEILVETMGWSPARANVAAGVAEVAAGQVPGTARWRNARRPPARRRSGHGPQYGEDAGVGYPGGLPWELQDREPLTDAERLSLTHGVALARQTLAAKGIPRT